jgi:hypothetical protein
LAIDGCVSVARIPINLRLEMLWPTKIAIVAGACCAGCVNSGLSNDCIAGDLCKASSIVEHSGWLSDYCYW